MQFFRLPNNQYWNLKRATANKYRVHVKLYCYFQIITTRNDNILFSEYIWNNTDTFRELVPNSTAKWAFFKNSFLIIPIKFYWVTENIRLFLRNCTNTLIYNLISGQRITHFLQLLLRNGKILRKSSIFKYNVKLLKNISSTVLEHSLNIFTQVQFPVQKLSPSTFSFKLFKREWPPCLHSSTFGK